MVARFGTFDEDFFDFAGIGVLPIVTKTYAGLYFIDVLAAGAGRAEGVPLDFALVDDDIKGFGFGQHGHCGGRGVDAPLRLGGRHALHTVNATFVLECAVNIGACDGTNDFFESAGGTF